MNWLLPLWTSDFPLQFIKTRAWNMNHTNVPHSYFEPALLFMPVWKMYSSIKRIPLSKTEIIWEL